MEQLSPRILFGAFLFVGLVVWVMRRRGALDAPAAEILQFAEDHGYRYLGSKCPEGLSLKGTSLGGWRFSVKDVLTGEFREGAIAIFEVFESRGENVQRQTVVGFARVSKLACNAAPVDRIGSFKFEISGDWLLGYVEYRVVDSAELEGWCEELYDLAARLILDEGATEDSGQDAGKKMFREF